MSCFSKYFEFYPGEDKDLDITLNVLNRLTDCKEALDLAGVTAADITVEVPANPTDLIFNGAPITIVNAVKGEIKVPITAAQTANIQSGTIVVRVVKSGKTIIFTASGASKRLMINNC